MNTVIAGHPIHYDVRGQGPAILLLHAFPLHLGMWEEQVEPLASKYQVVRFDARGFGGSPPGDGLLTMERIADDAVTLLEQLGIQAATVCGLSMGGYAALALMRRRPDRTKALVLADTRAGADAPEARQNRAALAEKVRRDGPSAVIEAMLPALLGPSTHATRPDVVACAREMILSASPRAITDALAGLAARADSTPSLSQIRVPTLILCGEEDTITPLGEAEALHRGISNSRLEIVGKAGHLSNLENPESFNTVLRGFMDEIG